MQIKYEEVDVWGTFWSSISDWPSVMAASDSAMSDCATCLESGPASGLSISRVRRPGLSNFSLGPAPIAFNKSYGLA